jgi:WavE lipopolysaccharide synthesis
MDTVSADQITIVIQGNYTDETGRIIESIKRRVPAMPIVLSCWESNRDAVGTTCPEGITAVFSRDPGAPVITGFKVDNIRRQIISSRAGLSQVRTPWVVKIRSDIFIDPRLLPGLASMCAPIPVGTSALFGNKVVATSLTTLDARRADFYFHVCDWFYLGRVEDVRDIFSASLPEDDFFAYFQGVSPVQEICSRYRSETYLIYHIVRKKLGVDYPFSGYRSKQLVDLSHSVLQTNFVIVNSWNLGLRSSKFRRLYLWLQPDRYSELTCSVYHSQVRGVRANFALICDLVSRILSAIALPLFWLRNRVRAWRD